MKKKLLVLSILLLTLSGCVSTVKPTTPVISAEQVQLWAKQTVAALVDANATSNPIVPVAPQATPTIIMPITLQPTIAAPVIIQPTAIPRIPTVAQPVVQKVCDQMGYVADVTVPDDTVLPPNSTFQKVWRIRNTGTCTWTPAYQFVFESGNPLNAPVAINLTQNVAPNDTIDIAVNMQAPAVNGTYQGFWKIRNPSGVNFGTSSATNNAIWVKVSVNAGQNQGTVPIYTGGTQQPVVGNGTCTLLSVWPTTSDSFAINEETDFRYTVRNDSNIVWTAADFDLAYIDGNNMMKRKDEVRRDMPVDVPPGGSLTFALDAVVPNTYGLFSMNWGVVRGFEVLCTIPITVNVNR